VFNFIKKIALAALSFFLLRIFFSRTKSFIDIEDIINRMGYQWTMKTRLYFTDDVELLRIPFHLIDVI